MKILFLQRKSLKCGVSDYGKRLFKILAPAMDITFHEIEGPYCVPEEYDAVLVNYHHATIPWPLERGRAKMIALFHEAFQNINPDKWVNVQELPRPVPPWMTEPVHLDETLRIGTFGFGFADKNYLGIAKMIKREFAEAIFRIHLPFAEFGDENGDQALARASEIELELKDSNIKVQFECRYMEPNDLTAWLSQNDLNVFNCIPTVGRGISSSIDYALAARRPIGISSSEMYRHLPREICVETTSLPRLIGMGLTPLRQVYEDNSTDRVIEKFKSILYA